MKNNNYFIFDIETGGLNPKETPITEFAVKVISGSTLLDLEEYQAFVQPYNNLIIDPDVLAKTHVTMRDVETGLDSKKLVNKIIELAKDHNVNKKASGKPILVGHNIDEFDVPFLECLFSFHEQDLYAYFARTTIDTIALAKQSWVFNDLDGDKGVVVGYKLGQCCERIGVALNNGHTALYDVDANTKLFIHFTHKLRNTSTGVDNVADTKQHRKFFQF